MSFMLVMIRRTKFRVATDKYANDCIVIVKSALVADLDTLNPRLAKFLKSFSP